MKLLKKEKKVYLYYFTVNLTSEDFTVCHKSPNLTIQKKQINRISAHRTRVLLYLTFQGSTRLYSLYG